MFIAIISMSIMGLLFGLGLAYASRIFRVDMDPNVERVLHALPGANCGACGMAGCAMLAEAIVQGKAKVGACTPGGQEVYNRIAEILGVDAEARIKKTARVRCGGGKKAVDKYNYRGVDTCVAVSMISGGQKACNFGCLGFGDCVSVCLFDAIHMDKDGIPAVDEAKCTACGKCIQACPKEIIMLEDIANKFYVKCLSHDKAGVVKSICGAGCTGCKICEKLSGGAFIVENNLSRLDYGRVDPSTPLDLCSEKCPTKCIIKI